MQIATLGTLLANLVGRVYVIRGIVCVRACVRACVTGTLLCSCDELSTALLKLHVVFIPFNQLPSLCLDRFD